MPALSGVKAENGIAWQAWSAETFKRAKAEDKPVFLYLEAVWCHWCHVMQQTSLADPKVREKLARDFIAVRVDHDADPGLANRYRDYGWPALIFLSANGTDIAKRAGYREAADFARLLDAIRRDPSPEAESPVQAPAPIASSLSADARAYLLRRHDQAQDSELGGLRTAQKFLDRDSVEYALTHADQPAERAKAQATLSAARALIDPVWGGVYQYSTGGGWNKPHYEKIMRTQAGYLRIYALAYSRLRRDSDLQAARAIRDYLFGFLRSSEGAFYVSQDADRVPGEKADAYFALNDAGRRKAGIPRIDRNLYADANGQAAAALVALHAASGDSRALAAAIAASEWNLRERLAADGLFRHGAEDDGRRFLADSLFAADSMLSLYEVTADRRWIEHASRSAEAMTNRFRDEPSGFLTAAPVRDIPLRPLPDLAENIAAARFFNRLAHYSGKAAHREAAQHAMKWLAGIAERKDLFEEAGILLADEELGRSPAHFTIVGKKTDPAASRLFEAALRTPASYRRLEWWDRAEGPLPNADVEYPAFARAAAYVCTEGRCSRPSFEPEDYARQIVRLSAGDQAASSYSSRKLRR